MSSFRLASDSGDLRLHPATLPHEYDLVSHPQTMKRCLKKRDVHLVGDLVTCLRVFGAPRDDAAVVAGCDFLVASQLDAGVDSGSWPTRDADATSYAHYHAAHCAIRALYEPTFRGFGPCSPLVRAALGDAAPKHAHCGAKLYGAKHVKKIADHYKAENMHDDSAARNLDLEQRATRRLAGLLKWKKAMEAKTIDDYDDRDPDAHKKRNKRNRLR